MVGVVTDSIYESLVANRAAHGLLPGDATGGGEQRAVSEWCSRLTWRDRSRRRLAPCGIRCSRSFQGPPVEVHALTEQVDRALVRERLMASLAAGFGILGLVLAAVGLYGLLAYTVARRTNEIGIRMALGAMRREVLWMVIRHVLVLLGIGVAVGIPVAWAASRLVSSMLFGLTATDPLTIAAAIAVLMRDRASGGIPAGVASVPGGPHRGFEIRVSDMRWWRRQSEADLERELRAHLELEAEEQREAGLMSDQAGYAAQRAFGNTTLVKEATREMWGWIWIERCLQDLRYAARVLRKSPAFTAVAVLSLTLGIGANTAVFSLLDAVLLKSLPVRDPAQLRILTWVHNDKVPVHSSSGYGTRDARTGQNVRGSFSYAAYRLLSASVPQFSDLMAYSPNQFTVTAGGASEYALEHFVSGNYFTGLGVQPLIGRPILPEDEAPDAPRAVVLTYRYWEKRFGLDPAAIGRKIVVNQRAVTVAGVMPPGFQGLYPGSEIDLFVPLSMVDEMGQVWYSKTAPDDWWVQIFGRLKPGVSDEEAASAVRATLGSTIREYAGNVSDSAIPQVLLAPGARGVGLFRDYWSTRLYILSVTSGLILLIACVNLANLLLARASGRRHEIAVRLSIGASRGRLLRQLFTESLLLAGVGGLTGAMLAKPLCRALLQQAAGSGSLSLDARLDSRSLAFTFGLSLLTGVLFGLAPAWRNTRVDLSPAMKSGSHNATASGGRMRLGRILVSAQVALSVLLLVGAGLFVRTLASLSRVDLGFRPERLLTFQTDPSRNGYQGQRLADIYSRMREKIAAIPGVESVGMSQHGLIQGVVSNDNVFIPGRQLKPADSETYLCSARILS